MNVLRIAQLPLERFAGPGIRERLELERDHIVERECRQTLDSHDSSPSRAVAGKFGVGPAHVQRREGVGPHGPRRIRRGDFRDRPRERRHVAGDHRAVAKPLADLGAIAHGAVADEPDVFVRRARWPTVERRQRRE